MAIRTSGFSKERIRNMISNQVLQGTLDGIRSIARTELCICDMDGKTLASTIPEGGHFEEAVKSFVDSPADSQVVQGNHFFKVYDDKQLEFVVIAKGDNDETYMMGKLAAFQVGELAVAYKERYDKDNFIKNLLLDNLLLVDIYNRAKKLHIEAEARRVVYLIETHQDKDSVALETVRSLFAGKPHDFITALDEKNIIVVKELKANEGYDDLERTGKVILDMLNSEAMEKVNVSYGTIVNEIKDVSRSYKEAKMALDVGKIFFSEENIVAYAKLGIGSLIYQLPMALWKMYITDVFRDGSQEELNGETLSTINQFFEDNLNVSETSRNLYIHRNTLVYRLDKLQKLTDLDLRKFDDAVAFKIALMVLKYMNYVENMDPTMAK